jgi:hypothetical protein
MTEKELSEKLNVNIQTVRRLRYSNSGPQYVVISKRIMYRPEDVEKYIEDNLQQ